RHPGTGGAGAMTQVERIPTTPVDAPTSPAVAQWPATAAVLAKPVTAPRVDPADPRYKALRNFAISMSIFNILGYTVLGFEQPWTWPLFALAVGYSTEITVELVAAWAQRRRPGFRGHGFWGLYTFLLPTHITALAANMLLYANS